MPLVKRLRRRGVNMVVEANGELLFTPVGPVARWNNAMSQRVRMAAIQFAPNNKRPRWAHYGAPLKATMRAATDIDTAAMRVHTAVGSTAPYSAYVDQGTGIYAGNSPYKAKILPPWQRQSPSLYEHTWRPPTGDRLENWNEVSPVMIKGQKGQFFFDLALRAGFLGMRAASYTVPGTGGPIMSRAMSTFPDRLANFAGNTPVDSAFIAQLEEWRSWRTAAYNSRKVLGKGYVRERERRELATTRRDALRETKRQAAAERRRAASAERSRRYRARQRDAKGTDKAKAMARTISQNRARFIAAMIKKYGRIEGDVEFRNGYFYATVPTKDARGRTVFKEVRGKALPD